MFEKILLYLALKFKGDWEKIFSFLERKENIITSEFNYLVDNFQGKYITIIDDNYPNILKEVNRPPFVIFYKGSLDILENNKSLWIMSSYKIESEVIAKIKKSLRINNVIPILGYGIENENEILMKMIDIPSIIVKDFGIDNYTIFNDNKKINFKNSVLISEYPSHTKIKNDSIRFSKRLKIIFSNGVFLLNSLKEKDLFTTLMKTLEMKRNVYCLNWELEDKKNHNKELIKNGAIKVNGVNEIFE